MKNAPALELDKVLYATRPMLPHVKRERRIVWNLIDHLATNGWTVSSVWDGEDNVDTTDPKTAMETIFNLDDVRVYFTNGTTENSVLLVLGNDLDIISDWSYNDGFNGFNAVMEKFDSEAFA